MLAAQVGRGWVGDAAGELRDAVRDLARIAAKTAAAAGYRVEQPDLVPAIMAVVGDAESFAALRAGRLEAVPSTGELDVLTGMPQLAPVSTPLRPKREEAPAAAPDKAAVRNARREAERAEAAAAEARARFEDAERALAEADQDAEAAQARLEQAEAEVRAARDALRQAQQRTRETNHELRSADREAARARARLDKLTAG